MKKLFLIDGNAIIHRAFHALPPFSTSKGEQVNAVYGFSMMLLNLLNNQKPDYIAVSFDLKGKTFRHEEYEDYKATRVKAPDELYQQIPMIKDLVRAFEIPIYEVEGFEADDVLGTLSKQAENQAELEEDLKTYIVTGDMDTLQLVTENTYVFAPHKGLKENIIYTIPKVLGKYGLSPSQVPDMKGLQGDASDNIKGVAGIGPKTAKTLLQKYGCIENIYEHLSEIKGSVHDKLEKDHASAIQSKRLATIVTNAPIKLNLEECTTHQYNQKNVLDFFSELEFKSLIKRLETFNNHSDKKTESETTLQKTSPPQNQQTLF